MGNKIDLEDDRKVTSEEARQLADQHKMQYFETSAKLNKNIDELMQYLMEQVYKKMFHDENAERLQSVVIKGDKHKKNGTVKNNGGCCK